MGGSSTRYSATLISPRSSCSSSICSRFLSPHKISPIGGLSRPALVPVQPAQIELHLALVGWIEAAQLQLYGYQAAQAAMVEEQDQVEVPLSDGHALLPGDEEKSEPSSSRNLSSSRRMAATRSRSL